MELLALAGGAFPSGELACCCYSFIMLPLVVGLGLRAVYRGVAWPSVLALASVGLPCLALWVSVVNAEPSDDWEVTDSQVAIRTMAVVYSCLTAAVGLTLGCIIRKKLLSTPREVALQELRALTRGITSWLRFRFVGLAVLIAIIALLLAFAN